MAAEARSAPRRARTPPAEIVTTAYAVPALSAVDGAGAVDNRVLALHDGNVHLGETEVGDPVGLDLERLFDGRLLVQGSSGAGKSWTLRRLLERTAERVQQVILDPEGEFGSLAERFGHVAIDAARLDASALALAAARAREHRISLWVDLSQVERDPQMGAVAAILTALVSAPSEQWTPCLVAIDEAHLFAPQGVGQGASSTLRRASIASVTDMMSRGRKRGLCGVLATQRLVRLSKGVASEAGNVLIGRNVLDLDVKRAADAIGWETRRAYDILPGLQAGCFVAVGPAFNRSPAVLQVGPVATRHRGSTPRLAAAPLRRDDASELLDIAGLMDASAAEAVAIRERIAIADLRAVKLFIQDPDFPAGSRILNQLRTIAPLPAYVGQLGSQLGLRAQAVEDGLALLQRYGLAYLGHAAGGPIARAMP